MSIQLINHNEDLKRLKDDGYNISLIGGNILIQDIPYVNENAETKCGMIFCSFRQSGENIFQNDHTVDFVGDWPCNKNGEKNQGFVNGSRTMHLTESIAGSYLFSSKPESGMYANFYDKMSRYIELLSAPAKSLDPGISAKNFNYKEHIEENVFNYTDTFTARAGIINVTEGIKNQKIAIVGLGGTGAYLLDFISKTPVKEISIFDGDDMLNHNAFRIPGTISLDELREKPSKVEFLKKKYDNLRKGIIAHEVYLDATNLELLNGHDFIFLALDKAEAKKPIIDYMLLNNIPFVDLGMGITMVDNSLRGTIRKTLVTPNNKNHLNKIATSKQADEDLYASNIQISELNALNAIMGIIAWKKLYKFYLSDEIYHNSTFIIDEKRMHNEA